MAKYDIDRIHDIRITEVVSRLGGTLRRRGSHQVTNCLWHEDRHPSLVLYEAQGDSHCKCFACGHCTDTIGYVQQACGFTFQEACEWLSREFGIPTLDGTKPTHTYKRPVMLPKYKAAQAEDAPKVAIPTDYMQSTLSDKSTFCQCLRHIFPAGLVSQVAADYCLGMDETLSLNADVIFWTISRDGTVCDSRLQRYDTNPDSPQFFHSIPLYADIRTNYVGSLLARRGAFALPEGIEAGKVSFERYHLYGEHLLDTRPNDTIMLVESAKNALVGACLCPQYLWIAVGTKSLFTRPMLTPLANRRVIVIPDRDAIADWKQQAEALRDITHFRVSDICERLAPPNDAKYDIADHIIRHSKLF